MTAFAFGLVFFRFSRFLPYFFRFHEYFSPILSQFNAHRVDFFHLVIVSYNVHRIHIMALQVVLRILDFPPLYIFFFFSLFILRAVYDVRVCVWPTAAHERKRAISIDYTHTHTKCVSAYAYKPSPRTYFIRPENETQYSRQKQTFDPAYYRNLANNLTIHLICLRKTYVYT